MARLVAQTASEFHIADLARMDESNGFPHARIAAALRARLADLAMLASDLYDVRPSLTLWLTGFSTYTSLPASIAQMA